MVNPNWALRVCGTRLPREAGTEPARERRCSAIMRPLRCFSQRSSWAISPRWSVTRCDPKARPWTSAHRSAAPVGRALERDLARGFHFDRDAALVTQTKFGERTGQDTNLLREDQMLSMMKEVLEWLNRAKEAREVARQLTDPGASKAVLELAENFNR